MYFWYSILGHKGACYTRVDTVCCVSASQNVLPLLWTNLLSIVIKQERKRGLRVLRRASRILPLRPGCTLLQLLVLCKIKDFHAIDTRAEFSFSDAKYIERHENHEDLQR